jgi:hypothetical protein
VFPELRKLDPWSSRLSPGPRWCWLRSGFFVALNLGIQPLDGFGHEKQLLIGRGCIPFATLAEHRTLEVPKLLGRLRQLLLVCGDGFLLLRDDRRLLLLVRVSLFQLTNPLLTGRQLIGKRWTSVFHVLLNSRHRHWFRWHRKIFRVGVMHDAIADDAHTRQEIPSKISVRSLNRISEPSSRTVRAPSVLQRFHLQSLVPNDQAVACKPLPSRDRHRLKKRTGLDSTCWLSSPTTPTSPSATFAHRWGHLRKRRTRAMSAWPCPSC